MKHTYTKPVIALLVMALSFSMLSAQTVEYLNTNNINAGFGLGGNLFSSRDTGTPSLDLLYEVPRGSNMRAIFMASLWMSGLDAGGALHGAAQTYLFRGRNFYDGPVAAVYDNTYDYYFHRVFKITTRQINRHRGLTFPVSSLLVDTAILMWPAKGNPYTATFYNIDITSTLAPFVDVNHNGIYDPLNGDYPAICGDEAVFFVLNDLRGDTTASGCSKLGVEIRGLASVFIDSLNNNLPFEKRAVNNTVFVQYEVENKSTADYHDFYLSLFEDPDLGCFSNDRVGCDTSRNMMFAYNGSQPDVDCMTEAGYGTIKAAQGTILLNQNLSSFVYFTNGAVYSNADPSTCTGYRNYQTAHWNDGTHFMSGGTGYTGSTPTNYIFPDDPNDPTGWSEATESGTLMAGDRRMTGSVGPLNFNAGDVLHYDFAFTTSYDADTNTNMYKIVDTLKRDADVVQTFYNNNILGCRGQFLAARVDEPATITLSLLVFPNPANDLLHIQSAENMQAIELFDAQGRRVIQQALSDKKASLSTSLFARGLYLLKVKGEEKTTVKKIVLE